MTSKQKESIEQLTKAIFDLHRVKATWVESVIVKEMYGEKIVWEGIVEVFNIKGHPHTDRCYAWSSPIEGSTKRRYLAVLHIPPIDSPEKAVRAAIVHDHKAAKR